MEVAIDGSLFASNADNQVGVVCPSGRCTWPTYDTLGVCHVCKDVSDRLKLMRKVGGLMNSSEHVVDEEDASAYVLPNRNFLLNFNGMRWDNFKNDRDYEYRSATNNSST